MTPPLTEAALREMLSRATPGPWRDGQDGNLRIYGPDGAGEHSGLLATVYKGRANARLIVAAVNALPALLDCVAAGRELLGKLEAAFPVCEPGERPTIAELEAMLAAPGGTVEVKPDGSIHVAPREEIDAFAASLAALDRGEG